MPHLARRPRAAIAPALLLASALWLGAGLAQRTPLAASAASCTSAGVCAWGSGANGQLGLGDQSDQILPLAIGDLSGVVQVEAGGTRQDSFSLAVTSDGTVWAWGGNRFGQLGD